MNEQPPSLIEKILDHARWAPSGDNMQTWRFEILAEDHFVVHGYDTRDHCVYDLQGQASQLAIGALLESISIAASAFGNAVEFQLRANMPETNPTIDVKLISQADVQEDPLFPFLPIRSVQRRKFKLTPLNPEQKAALEQSVGKLYTVRWLEGWQNRWQAAWLMYKNAKLRLTLPEAFPTHSTIIEWNARFSEDKIPDQAVGLDPVATWLMKWALKSWQRVSFLNTYCFGTLLPRIELDLVPGIFCAAHFALIAEKESQSVEENLQAGRAIQRFWLTATKLGLQLQPEMTPLIFSGYINQKLTFTGEQRLIAYAEKLSNCFAELLEGKKKGAVVFMARIGCGEAVYARSIRLSVSKLMGRGEGEI